MWTSDEGSVAELEWNTWDEACALEFQNASGIFPPDSDVVCQAVNIKSAWDVCCTGLAIDTHGYVDGDIYIARLCLIGRSGVENIMQRNEKYGDVRRMNH